MLCRLTAAEVFHFCKWFYTLAIYVQEIFSLRLLTKVPNCWWRIAPAPAEDPAPSCGRQWSWQVLLQGHGTDMGGTLKHSPDVSNIKQCSLSLPVSSCSVLSRPTSLCDPTTLHSHSVAAERILSCWLTVSDTLWGVATATGYPMKLGNPSINSAPRPAARQG